MISCEYYEIFKNSFLIEYVWWLLLWVITAIPEKNWRHKKNIFHLHDSWSLFSFHLKLSDENLS